MRTDSLKGDRRKAVTPSEAASKVPGKHSVEDLAGRAQLRPVLTPGANDAAGGGFGSGNGTVVHAPVTINAGAQSPAEIAGNFQRYVSEARGLRTHDMEPELVRAGSAAGLAIARGQSVLGMG